MRRPDTHYAENGGVSIAYQVFGDGPLELVVVPGFVSNVETGWGSPVFVRIYERLAHFARVAVFDKRGTGLSDPVMRAPTVDECAEDIRAVMDAAGFTRAWILGISQGGPHAIVLAATHPERVAGLVLYGTFVANNRPGVPKIFRDENCWEVFFDSLEHWGEGRSLALFCPTAFNKPLQQRFWGLWERTGSSRAMARGLGDLVWNFDVSEVVPHVQVPTMALHYDDDFISVENSRWICEHIPGSTLVVLQGVNHAPADVAAADEMADEIERFITGTVVAPHDPDRAVATVLFTDIVSSTERAAAVGDAAWHRIVEDHDRLMRSLLVEHHGREIKTMGDGFLATFSSPCRAVHCAQAFAAAVEDLGISVRAGVHTGEIEIVDEDIAGLAVSIAARVSALASAGQVLATATVRDLTAGSDLRFQPHGDRPLKGVPGTWTLLECVDEALPVRELLGTREPSPHLHGKVMERVAYRSPRLARVGARAVHRFTGRSK